MKAVEHVRAKGEGPSLIEAKTYRYFGHSHSDPRVYRTKEEEQHYKDLDPDQEAVTNELETVGMAFGQGGRRNERAVKEKLDTAMELQQ